MTLPLLHILWMFLFVCSLLPAQSERYLADIRQLTSGGQNAEAYWSPDGTELVFQSTRGDHQCDQIYVMKGDGSDVRMVSTGKDADAVAAQREKNRELLGFLYSTPAYWPALEIFGCREVGEKLHSMTREGKWAEWSRYGRLLHVTCYRNGGKVWTSFEPADPKRSCP